MYTHVFITTSSFLLIE